MQAWSLTHSGMVRKSNQDAVCCKATEAGSLAVVCDGMGGAAAGDTASRIAIEVFTSAMGRLDLSVQERLYQAVEEANTAVYAHSRQHPDCRGMGTTLVAAVVQKQVAYVANVGDSRCYYIHGDDLRRITRDHSLVEELLRSGAITPEEARSHPRKNMITRALGTQKDCRVDLFRVELEEGGILLLCSDGLTNQVEDGELLEAARTVEPEALCRTLVELTLERGAPDNVTVAILRQESRGC